MSQLFKTKISIEFLLDFLEKINCQKMEHYYIVDITAYKRSIYIDALKPFLSQLKEFYYPSKYNYIDPENINQNKFNTIIRQICKYTNTHYEKKLRHDQSRYSVVYRIYFSSNSNPNPTSSVSSIVNND
jgi:retron-type reverse transcriptase